MQSVKVLSFWSEEEGKTKIIETRDYNETYMDNNFIKKLVDI
jgi:hypothetical protein